MTNATETKATEALLCLAYFHAGADAGLGGRNLVDLAPQLLGEVDGLERFEVLVGKPRPRAFTMPAEMELRSADTPATPYDGAVVVGGTKDAVEQVLEGKLRPLLDSLHAYRVDEKVIFNKADTPNTSEPVTFLLSIQWFSDLPETAVHRSWRAHEPLAERVHVGSNRYVQWWVYESFDEDAPAVGGVVEMGFPDIDSLVNGFFDSPRGELDIVQDSAHFIAGGHPRVFVEEHRFTRSATAT